MSERFLGAPIFKNEAARTYISNIEAWLRGRTRGTRTLEQIVNHETGHAVVATIRGFPPIRVTVDTKELTGSTEPNPTDVIAQGSEWKKLPDDVLPLMLMLASGYAGEIALSERRDAQEPMPAHELAALIYLCQLLEHHLRISAAKCYTATVSAAISLINDAKPQAEAFKTALARSLDLAEADIRALLEPLARADVREIWQRELERPSCADLPNLCAELQSFTTASQAAPVNKPEHIAQSLREMTGFRDVLQSGRAALCFSGGKDSVACLLLLRPLLPFIYVIFANTGKGYPETMRTVELAKTLCPNWIEVRTDRDTQWKANGLPSDLVPIDWTTYGQQISGPKPIKIQSYHQCCAENISQPVWNKAKELGVALIIRGQRNDEQRKGLGRSGTLEDGMRIWHPIEKWTAAQVYEYLRAEIGELPAHAYLEHSSMDCFDCTAFTKNALDRAKYTKAHHPELYRIYIDRMKELHGAMLEQMHHYEAIIQTETQC